MITEFLFSQYQSNHISGICGRVPLWMLLLFIARFNRRQALTDFYRLIYPWIGKKKKGI
jgi:hypothetical protein